MVTELATAAAPRILPGYGYNDAILSLSSGRTKLFMIVMKAQIEPKTVLTIPIRRQGWTRRSLGMLCPDPVDPVLLPGVEGRRPMRRCGFMMGSVLGFALSLPRFEVLWNTERTDTELPQRCFQRTFVPSGSVSSSHTYQDRPFEVAAQLDPPARAQLMCGAMRLSAALGMFMAAACAPQTSGPPAPSRCGPSVPETAQHPISVAPLALAGDYELIQVQTQPSGGRVVYGRLHLAPLDSAARAGASGGAVRDLVGWLELAGGDSLTRSRKPRVALAGQHLIVARAGYAEGGAHNLEITAVAPEGLWGWWKADRGLALTETQSRRVLPDPAGYFCALRLGR